MDQILHPVSFCYLKEPMEAQHMAIGTQEMHGIIRKLVDAARHK